jgi:hypothetical protein
MPPRFSCCASPPERPAGGELQVTRYEREVYGTTSGARDFRHLGTFGHGTGLARVTRTSSKRTPPSPLGVLIMTRFIFIAAALASLLAACAGHDASSSDPSEPTDPTEQQGEDLSAKHNKCTDAGGSCMSPKACDYNVGRHDGWCEAAGCPSGKACYHPG